MSNLSDRINKIHRELDQNVTPNEQLLSAMNALYSNIVVDIEKTLLLNESDLHKLLNCLKKLFTVSFELNSRSISLIQIFAITYAINGLLLNSKNADEYYQPSITARAQIVNLATKINSRDKGLDGGIVLPLLQLAFNHGEYTFLGRASIHEIKYALAHYDMIFNDIFHVPDLVNQNGDFKKIWDLKYTNWGKSNPLPQFVCDLKTANLFDRKVTPLNEVGNIISHYHSFNHLIDHGRKLHLTLFHYFKWRVFVQKNVSFN